MTNGTLTSTVCTGTSCTWMSALKEFSWTLCEDWVKDTVGSLVTVRVCVDGAPRVALLGGACIVTMTVSSGSKTPSLAR